MKEKAFRLQCRSLVDPLEVQRDAIELLLPEPVALPASADLTRASWLVAGLTVFSDWLGSSQAVFEYERPDYDLATYWRTMALPRAHRAVERSGVIPTASAPVQSYAR